MDLIKKNYDVKEIDNKVSNCINNSVNNSIGNLINNQRPNWDEIFMENTFTFAKRSLCLKLQTAAIIVYNTQILSIGYNGTFCKSLECCEYWYKYYLENTSYVNYEDFLKSYDFAHLHREWSKSNEMHAETNALKWITPNTENRNYIMYTLYSPCDLCAKEIISYRIKKVVYKYKYKHGDNALLLLKKYNIEVLNIN